MPIVDPFDKKAGGIVDPFDKGGAVPAAPANDFSEYSGTDRFLIGVGAGMFNMYKGVQQTLASAGEKAGVVSPETTQRITREGMEAKASFAPLRKESTAASVGEFVGEVAPTLALPGGVGGGVLKRAGTAALTGGALGATSFVPEGESRVSKTAIGAGLGAAGSAVLSGAGKLVNAAIEKIPRNELGKLSERFKIPLSLGEETGNVATQKKEVLLERVPWKFGIKDFRKAQLSSADTAAKDFLGKYIADPSAADTMAANRGAASKIYESVKGLVAQVPKQEIIPTETKAIADELVSRYPDIFKKLQDTQTEGIVANIVKGTKGKTGISAKGVLTVDPKTLTFEEMWSLRQGLGEKIGQAKKLLARGEVDQTAVSQLKSLFSAVNRDMDAWTASIKKPEISQGLQAANEAYKTYVVKYNILQRAYDKASGAVGAKEMFSPKTFSTSLKKIAYDDKSFKLFKPQELEEMTGLANIMQVVKRASQFAENPPTGNRWGPLTTGGLIEGGAYAAGGVAGAVKTAGVGASVSLIAKFLTTTEAGKKLALIGSKVEPTSPQMEKVLAQIYNQVPKFAAMYGLKENSPQ